MAKNKTPIIKSFREKGGTFCTFNSAIEDIGLNINEKQNKVRLSHYAILDIPKCDYTNNLSVDDASIKNVFNLLSSPGAFYLTHNDDNINNSSVGPTTNIAQSFMSYALNMEAVVRNQNNMSSNYDYTTHLSVSERVFWKWLKETGAIRWVRLNDTSYFKEESDSECYNSVVKSFGKIDAVAQRSSDYGMYNEVYVNIPSSFGKNSNILFKQIEDNNYSFGKAYAAGATHIHNLEGHENDEIVLKTGLYNKGYYDYISTMDSSYFINPIWFEDGNYPINTANDYGAYFIVDNSVGVNASLNDVITINDNTIKYKIKRSKLDCMSIELDCNNIAKALKKDIDELTYDKLNSELSEDYDYTFNTILVYYSIYDDNDNILATNLYGVYFIDAPIVILNNGYISNENFYNFEIPRLTKKKSSIEGFGNSYSFKLNIRTSSIYDDKVTPIYDNSSSENSLVEDFNEVVSELKKSVSLLNKHTKNTEILVNKYDEIYQMFLNIYNDVEKIKQDIVKIKNN